LQALSDISIASRSQKYKYTRVTICKILLRKEKKRK